MESAKPSSLPTVYTAAWWSVMGFVLFASLWLGLGHALLRDWIVDPDLRFRAVLISHGVFVLVSATALHAFLRRFRKRGLLAESGTRAQQLLSTLVEGSTDAIFAKDASGRFLLANRATGELFGQAPELMLGADDHLILPPDQVAGVHADDRQVMLSGSNLTIEETLETAQGPRTFLTTKGPLRDAKGEIFGLFGIARDITERVAVQAALQTSERRYRQLFEVSPLPMAVVDLKTLGFKAVNQAAVDCYGYAREALLGMDIFAVHPPDEQARLKAEMLEHGGLPPVTPLRDGQRWIHQRQDGRRISVDVVTSEMEFDGELARLVVVRDMTQQVEQEHRRQEAQAEVQRVRALLEGVLERVDDGFVALDKRWCYTYVNQAAAKILGRNRPEDLVGRHIWTEFPDGVGQAFHKAYLQASETQLPVIFEDHYAPWGKWFENRVYPSSEGLTIYFSDVTDRKRAERVLQDRERDFRELAEQMPALIYRAALDGSNRTLYVSSHIRVLGFTPEQWMADPRAWLNAVHPDDLERVVAALPTATSAHAEAQVEYRMRNPVGGWRHYRDSNRRVRPDDGGTPYLQGVSIDITDRIEADEALVASAARLRLSEQRYRLAAANGMVWDWDLVDGRFGVGGRFFEDLGLPIPQAPDVVKSMEAAMHPDDRAGWHRAVRDYIQYGRPYQLEFRARDAKGHWHWFETQGSGLRDQAGRVTYMAGTTVDITERIEALEALKESEARLRASEQRYRLAASHGQVWDWDAASGRMEIGDDFWRQLGLPPVSVELNVARIADWMHPEDRPVWERSVRAHLLEHKPYNLEFRVRDAQGRWRWMHTEGQAVWDDAGKATYMAGTTMDITARKDAQAALQASEAYRRQLFEQLSDGVLLIGADHRVLDANPKAWELLGLDREGLLARSLSDLLAEQEQGRIDRLSEGRHELVEWAFVRSDGGSFPAEASTRTLDEQRYLVVLRDITQRRKSENALLTYQLELTELTHQLLMQEKQMSRRIAQALHDRLGQTLAVTRLNLDAVMVTVQNQVPSVLLGQCERIDTLLAQAVGEVRDVLRELRPPLLEEQGLAAALDNEVAAPGVGLGEIDILLETNDDVQKVKWPADVEYSAFMVAREAITNALQHARPSLVRVVLSGNDTSLRLDVIDDGVGISTDMVRGRPGHLGVVGMRERALSIGAHFEVKPCADRGTCVLLVWEAPRK